MAVSIEEIPAEVIVMIFKKLTLADVENCSMTFTKWKKIAAIFFMKPHLESLSQLDQDFKITLQEAGLTEDSYNSDLIWTLYKKYKSYKDKVLSLIHI